MSVNVEDTLARTRTRVEDKAELAIGLFTRQVVSQCDHLGEKSSIRCSELGNIAVVVARHNEQVHRGLRVNIPESNRALGAPDDIRG